MQAPRHSLVAGCGAGARAPGGPRSRSAASWRCRPAGVTCAGWREPSGGLGLPVWRPGGHQVTARRLSFRHACRRGHGRPSGRMCAFSRCAAATPTRANLLTSFLVGGSSAPKCLAGAPGGGHRTVASVACTFFLAADKGRLEVASGAMRFERGVPGSISTRTWRGTQRSSPTGCLSCAIA